MNHCAIQQSAFAACEEMRSSSLTFSLSISDKRDTLVCPKPRRISIVSDHMRPLRWHMSHQQEACDSKAGTELLDIIRAKGGYGVEQSRSPLASSPPFFCGSPPSRVSNPLIQDARFVDGKNFPISPQPIPVISGVSSSPTSRKGVCARANFGNKPAVRVEGFEFNCIDRDRRNCSIPTLA